MDDELGRKLEPRSDFRLARFATVQGYAGSQKFRASRPVDGTVHASATQKGTVRRVHDGIDLQLRDVAPDNFNLDHVGPLEENI
jgi:hypothetical protein